MAEHHLPHHVTGDPQGQRVGMLAAVLAVALAIVGIASHRAHTGAILHLSAANQEWSRYEAATVKSLHLEVAEDLRPEAGGASDGAEKTRADYALQKRKYEQQAAELQEKADRATGQAEADEHRALRYDIGGGLLEVSVFLTSLYFLSRKSLFPAMGLAIGIGGILVAVTGRLL